MKSLAAKEKTKLVDVKEVLEICNEKYRELNKGIEETNASIETMYNPAAQKTKDQHERILAMKDKTRKEKDCLKKSKDKLNQILQKKEASLAEDRKREIRQINEKYDNKLDEIHKNDKEERETLDKNHIIALQKLSNEQKQIEKKMEKQNQKAKQKQEEKVAKVLKISKVVNQLAGRMFNNNATRESIHHADDDRITTQCLPELHIACKRLADDFEKESFELASLLSTKSVRVIKIDQMKGTKQKIQSITSCGKNCIAITGYESRYNSFLAIVDSEGKQRKFTTIEAKKSNTKCFIASLSDAKVVIASKFNLITIFNTQDLSILFQKDISRIIPLWVYTWRLSCVATWVATDRAKKEIYVGASNLNIYVFNERLNHVQTLDLTKIVKSIAEILILERDLLVCDDIAKRAYIVTRQGGLSVLAHEMKAIGRDEYCPLSACTDKEGCIFMLWSKKQGEVDCQFAKYSRDGRTVITTGRLDKRSECVTIMEQSEGKECLVAATTKINNMFCHTLVSMQSSKKPMEKVIYQSKYNRPDNRATSALRVSDLGASTSGYSSTQPGTTQTARNTDVKKNQKEDATSSISNMPAQGPSGEPGNFFHTEVRMQQGNREITFMGGKSSQAPKRTYSTASNRSPLSSGSACNTDVKKNKKEDATSSISNMPAQRLSGQPADLSQTEVRKQQGNRKITLIGGKSSQAPKRTYPTASNRSPLSSRSARNTDVKKIKKEDATSAIPNMPAQRLSGEPVDLFHTEVRKQQGNRENTLDGGKCSQALKRTYPTASNRSPFSSSSVTTKTKAPILLQPKQQVIQCDVRSVKRNIGTTYNKSEASIFSHLKEELSLKLTQTDCGNLGRYFSLPPDQVQTIISSPLYSDKFLLALEERGYINPSNVNRLTDALTELKINHTHLTTKTCMELRDQETEYDTFLAGLSAYLTFSITKKLCDNFEVTDENKNTVISSQNPGLSFLLTIDEMGIINPSDVSKLKSPLEEYRLLQAIAKIHEYQSLVLSDKAMPQDEDKENLFLKCLQQKTKSWFETMTPVPWMKSCQWNSNDLFIASRLVLTNSGSSISSREVDRKCKLHYLDIFTDERLKAETRIILEGQPGSGKTMLSSQLAYDWCCGKLDIPMVIFLPLKIVGNMTIIQAIKMFYIRKGIPIAEEDIVSMLNSDKKKVYLILDGLEEYNGVTKDGSPSEVMRVMTKEKLSNCIVIITARTDYTKHLPPGPILKIGSFGEDEMTEYIEKVYSDDVKRQGEVKELIDNIPFVLDLCNIPLLFVLLVHNIDRLGKLQEAQLDRVTPFVKAIVDILCPVQDEEDTHSHLSDQKTYITLEELAFNGLCRGNQQLFWQKDFVDRSVTNSKALVDSGILVIEEGTPFNSSDRNLETASGSGTSQTDSISDESLNTSNVTSEIKRGVPLEPDILASINQSESNPILESKEKQSEPLLNRKTPKYISQQVKFLHKLIQEWFAAKYLARFFWGHKSTEHHDKNQLFREHLANIDPADLHYVLRFTCHICPPSFHVIASFLMRDFKTGDGEIPDYIINCICLCFGEHDEYKGHKFKDIVTEICRRESVNFSSGDSRILLRSKVSMLTFASRSKVPIKRLKFSDVVEKVTDKALVLQDDVWLGILETLEAIEMDRWDQKLIDKDYEDLLKFILNCKHVHAARLLFPSPPKNVTDDKILKALQSRNISVEWTIGANAIHTLDVHTGKWPMEFRLHSRNSNEPSATKAVKDIDLDTSLSTQSLVNKKGGILEIPGTGVRLEIPSGAIEQECLIQMRIIPISFQKDSKSSFTSNSTVVVELLPNNLKLHQLAKLTLPHCLQLKNTGERKAMVYSSHHAKGSKPMWRPKPNHLYQLNDTNCVIWIESFSWETCQIDDRNVEYKKIQVYAACNLDPLPEIIPICVGFYPKLPGERPNEMLILKEIPFLFRKAGNLPLQILFNEVKPMSWKYTGEAKWRLQEIPFMNVVTDVDCQRSFVFEKVGEEDCILIFEAMQEDPVHLIVQFKGISASPLSGSLSLTADAPQPKKRCYNESTAAAKDGVEDFAASSYDTVVAAGLSQSQKRTCDESLAVKKNLENIDLEVRTGSLKNISENIPKEWKSVGRKLGLDDSELCNLERDYAKQGHTEIVYQMFLYWKQRNGSKATYRVLGEALEAAGRRDLQEKLY
ncbi:uncharacterized protein [Apostichopus japonicus]|uniref:uncharacterized protein n=1 Tax=Stichopus japonicus TaxID=307972 RepID=UPI003AB5F907